MVLRHFGASGIRAALAEHIRLARLFASWVQEDSRFEVMAPVPFSVVCFRAKPLPGRGTDADALNQRLLDAVNSTGEVFLSHTRLNGKLVIRLAIGHLRTAEVHIARAWTLIRQHTDRLDAA
jgi:aromatic-L-amino-acid decarboxylase